jgi:hypothetical protein
VDVGPGDARRVGGQDDRAVHLRELREPLRRELRVEEEPAGADRQDLGTVTHDDERTHAGLQDAVEALAQRLSGRDEPQRGEHRVGSAGSRHRGPPDVGWAEG